MPWNPSDALEHKKGLTEKQQRQWAHIANSHLSKCMDEGGDESVCAGEAIRMANGSVNTNEMEVYVSTVVEYVPKTKMYQGKKHLIVPVTMMVEGVHAGSAGPLLHRKEDLGHFPASWDGMPVMIDHPQIDGYNVSANIPEVLENSVGRVFNTHMVNTKLKAEIWFDEQKLIAISPQVCALVQEGKALEVSVGVYTDTEEGEGVYINTNTNEEETYIAVAKNHRPDHLAVLLPGITGACSVKDGCGIRVNRANSGVIVKDEKNDMSNDVILVMRQQAHENILASITDNQQGYQELLGKVSEKLYMEDSEEEYNMLEEVYGDSVVYRKRCSDNSKNGFYQQAYKVNEDESVEFVGDPKRVRRSVSYVQANALIRTKFNKKGDIPMPEEDTPCCLEKVVELLNNKQLGLTEADDREWLLGLGPERLARITPKEPEVIEVNKEVIVEVQVPVETDLTDYVRKDSFKTAEDILAVVPEEMKEQFTAGLQLHQAHRDELIDAIIANSNEGVWTKEELNVETTAKLEKLSKQFKAPVDYSAQGAGGGLQANKGKEDKLLPLGV